MEKDRLFQVMRSILEKLDNGINDIDPSDFGIEYDDFKEVTDLMLMMELIDGPDTFYDGLLNYETAYITAKGKSHLKTSS